MTAPRELLDWSDLYGDGAVPAGGTAANDGIKTPRARSSTAGASKSKPSGTTGHRPSARNSLNGTTGSAPRRASTPRGGSVDGPTRPAGPRKIEQLAQPLDRYGRPLEPPKPNYGTLLSFSEEERRDAARREKRLSTPRKPTKEKRNYTIPEHDDHIERLAQPRQPHQDPEAVRPVEVPLLPNGRPALPDLSVYDRLVRPKRVVPEANVLGGGGAVPQGARKGSRSRSVGQQRPRGLSMHPPSDEALSRLAQPKQRWANGTGSSLESSGKKVYGGTTPVEYTPTQPARARTSHGRPGTEPVWTNIQRPRPAVLPTRDSSEYRKECIECDRIRQEQQRQAATAAAAARGPVIVKSEHVEKRPETPPEPQPVVMPKPPLEVRTKRFQPKDDVPLWPPLSDEPEDAAPPAAAPVPVVAARRAKPLAITAAAEPNPVSAPEPPQEVQEAPKPVPATLAVRRTKPKAAPEALQPFPPRAAAQPSSAGPSPPPATAGTAPSLQLDALHTSPSPHNRSTSGGGGALGQRVSLSTTPRGSSPQSPYKAPPARKPALKVRRSSTTSK